jgi:hypothetical protein
MANPMRVELFYLATMIGFGYFSFFAGMILRKQKTMPVLAFVTIFVGVVYMAVAAWLLFATYSSLQVGG